MFLQEIDGSRPGILSRLFDVVAVIWIDESVTGMVRRDGYILTCSLIDLLNLPGFFRGSKRVLVAIECQNRSVHALHIRRVRIITCTIEWYNCSQIGIAFGTFKCQKASQAETDQAGLLRFNLGHVFNGIERTGDLANRSEERRVGKEC